MCRKANYLETAVNKWMRPLIISDSTTKEILFLNNSARKLLGISEHSEEYPVLNNLFSPSEQYYNEFVENLYSDGEVSRMLYLQTNYNTVKKVFVDGYVCNGYTILQLVDYSNMEANLRIITEESRKLTGMDRVFV